MLFSHYIPHHKLRVHLNSLIFRPRLLRHWQHLAFRRLPKALQRLRYHPSTVGTCLRKEITPSTGATLQSARDPRLLWARSDFVGFRAYTMGFFVWCCVIPSTNPRLWCIWCDYGRCSDGRANRTIIKFKQ